MTKKKYKKLTIEGKQKEFVNSNAELTILISSRGFGKSVAAAHLAAKKLTNGESGVIMGVTYRDVKTILLRNIINILQSYGYQKNKHYKLYQSDAELHILNKDGSIKSICFYRSSDNPDCARGISNASFFIMDEAAIAPKSAFDATSPVLRGENVTKTQTYLITSPRGQGNWVSVLFKQPDTKGIQASVYDCTWMNDLQRDNFIRTNKARFSELFFRQEILGEIIDVSADSVLSNNEIDSIFQLRQHVRGELIAGLDIGRKNDPCALAIKDGNRIVYMATKYDTLTEDIIIDWVKSAIAKFPQLKRIYIDETGLGQFIPSRMQKELPSVECIGVNFASKETKSGYAKRRSEIFFDLKRAAGNGLHFCPSISTEIKDNARTELCAIEYTIDGKSNFAVKSKDDTKAILGHSPDIADALALMCHDMQKVSQDRIDSTVRRLSKPSKQFPNRKG